MACTVVADVAYSVTGTRLTRASQYKVVYSKNFACLGTFHMRLSLLAGQFHFYILVTKFRPNWKANASIQRLALYFQVKYLVLIFIFCILIN